MCLGSGCVVPEGNGLLEVVSQFVTCCIPISNVKNRLGTELCTPITATKGEGSKECTIRHHDHPWNHLAGHYCEFPAGDVDSPVFVFDVHCQKKVLCPFTGNGLHGE